MNTIEEFEDWLLFVNETVDQLIDHVSPETSGGKLDFSLESLSVLEQWILSRYPSTQSLLLPSENWILDRLAKYVGEVIRQNVGGDWTIDLTNTRNVYYRLPVIRNESRWVECPASLVTAAADRRQGNYIERIVRNLLRM